MLLESFGLVRSRDGVPLGSRRTGDSLTRRQKYRSQKMGDRGIIIEYVRSCTAGALGISDCGPVWQLAIIAAVLMAAIVTLLVLRLRATVRAQ